LEEKFHCFISGFESSLSAIFYRVPKFKFSVTELQSDEEDNDIPYLKPNNFEQKCKMDLNCDVHCDVCCQLPYHASTGVISVHHFNAATGRWNEHKRFEDLELYDGNIIFYVGGNTDGADGVHLMQQCPKCKMHIFEPVPEFSKKLLETWKNHVAQNNWDVTVHDYGLGAYTRTIQLKASEIVGQSTFGMKGSDANLNETKVDLQIMRTADVVKILTSGTGGKIDLLHVNCEGCEWEMLENLIEDDIHKNIRMVQFSSHYFRQVKDITSRYCNIKSELRKTHTMVYGQSWGWERWDRATWLKASQ